MASISRYPEQKLKVKVNQAKSKVSPVKENSVLGFKIHHKKLRALDSKVEGFKRELKRITRRCPGIMLGTTFVRSRVRTRKHGSVGRRRLRPPLTRSCVWHC